MERYTKNPILTRKDIPGKHPLLKDVTSVFNPGGIRFNDKYLLILRVQNRGRETFFMIAESTDGLNFKVNEKPVHFKGIENVKEKIFHCYDARITDIDGVYYIMFAMDMESGCHLGLGKTPDFKEFEFLGITSKDDTRNGVLFSEKINGKYLRLERPNKVQITDGPTTGSSIILSESDDLLNWKQKNSIIDGRFHYWDEYIGAGPPPIKTREGWLQIYHGVATHLASIFIYQAGVFLLDLNDPSKVIGRCKQNILEPREMYELIGQVPNVVFPGAAIVESYDENGFAANDSKVLVYYGAADTCIALATTTIAELLNQALNE
jgi:beta-1,4-mannooligosaccharide/beta-1,4-mannosyl-N-acetylglucosamine phosphorylase